MAAHRTTTSRLPINTQQLLRVRTIAAQGLSAAKSHQDSGLTRPKDGPRACRDTGKRRRQRVLAFLAPRVSCLLARSSAKMALTTTALRLGQTAHRGEKTQDNYPAGACLRLFWLVKTAQTTTAPRLGQTAHRGEKTQDNYPAGACLRLFRLVKNDG